jgi:2-polyprenyl-3-methyl-5-hydroxy-6-metoxy-1,4-benzoquinol methylase
MTHAAPGEATDQISCPLCGGTATFSHRRADGYLGVHPEELHDVFRCDVCRSWFCGPIDGERLGDYYPVEYYGPYLETDRSSLHGLLSNMRQRGRATLVSAGLQPGASLDIGCGRGAVVAELRDRGWRASGTDWNVENAKLVSDRLGVDVYGGPSALEQVESESIDVVSMFHVLEHDDDPRSMLHDVRRVLRPGGRLVVAVPSGSSATRALFGPSWFGFDTPRHRVLFTRDSLRTTLTESGFEVTSMRGRLSDELLDLKGTVDLWMADQGITSGPVRLATLAVVLPVMLVARTFGFGSVAVAIATRRR